MQWFKRCEDEHKAYSCLLCREEVQKTLNIEPDIAVTVNRAYLKATTLRKLIADLAGRVKVGQRGFGTYRILATLYSL